MSSALASWFYVIRLDTSWIIAWHLILSSLSFEHLVINPFFVVMIAITHVVTIYGFDVSTGVTSYDDGKVIIDAPDVSYVVTCRYCV